MEKTPEGFQRSNKVKRDSPVSLDQTECIIDDDLINLLDASLGTSFLDLTGHEEEERDTERSDPTYRPSSRAQGNTQGDYTLRSHLRKPTGELAETGIEIKVEPELTTETVGDNQPTSPERNQNPPPQNAQIQDQNNTPPRVPALDQNLLPPIGPDQNQAPIFVHNGQEVIQENIQGNLQVNDFEIPQDNPQALTMGETNDKLVERYTRFLPVLEQNQKSLETFIRKADTLFALLPDNNAKGIFLNCVKNSTTESTYADIAALTTWDGVKQELKAIILPRKTVSQLHNELTNITKSPAETIVEFAENIKKVANGLKDAHRLSDRTVAEADWKLIFDIIETQSLTTFTQGLSPQLRNWVMARDFKTLREAESHARTLEYLDVEPTQQTPPIPSLNQTRQGSNQLTRPPPRECGRCHKLGHTADRCFASNIPRINFSGIPRDTNGLQKPRGINPIRDNFSRYNSQGPRVNRPDYQRPDLLCTHCGGRNHTKESCFQLRAAIKCTYCGRAGHTIANCLRKISDQPHVKKINHMYYGRNPGTSTQSQQSPTQMPVPIQQTCPMVMIPLEHYIRPNEPETQQGYFENQAKPSINSGNYDVNQTNNSTTPFIPSTNVRASNNANNFQILGPANIQEKGTEYNLLNLENY